MICTCVAESSHEETLRRLKETEFPDPFLEASSRQQHRRAFCPHWIRACFG